MNIFKDKYYSIKDSSKILGSDEFYIESLISQNKIKYFIDEVNSPFNTEETDRIKRLINALNKYAIEYFNNILSESKDKFTLDIVSEFAASNNPFECMLTYCGYNINNVRIVLSGNIILNQLNANKSVISKYDKDPLFLYIRQMLFTYYSTNGKFQKIKELYSSINDELAKDEGLAAIIIGKDSNGDYILHNDKILKFRNFQNICTKIIKSIKADLRLK